MLAGCADGNICPSFLPLLSFLPANSSALSIPLSPRLYPDIRVTIGSFKMPIKKETKEKQVKGDEGAPSSDLVMGCVASFTNLAQSTIAEEV